MKAKLLIVVEGIFVNQAKLVKFAQTSQEISTHSIRPAI
jgi:hypothetical protein